MTQEDAQTETEKVVPVSFDLLEGTSESAEPKPRKPFLSYWERSCAIPIREARIECLALISGILFGPSAEKRGKEHEVPVHSKAKKTVDLWLERSHLASNASAPLFPSFGKNRETIEQRRLDRRSVLKLVEKRAKASGILKRVLLSQLPCDGCH